MDPTYREILTLATRYKDAAIQLGCASPKQAGLPLRLLALRSIGFYLDGLLLAKGFDHATIRGLEQDLAERSRIAVDIGLVLRKRTAAHLFILSSSGECRIITHGLALGPLSQINRVMATLDEVSRKVPTVLRASVE